MKKTLILFIFLLPLVFFTSCSKKKEVVELKYTAEEFYHLIHEATLSNDKGEGALKFSDYLGSVNRLESKAFIYKRLSFFAISFEKVEEARAEALRLNQYYARNWLFDQVEGEPVLEDYVITTFQAINPKRQIQRVPKTHGPSAHGKESDHQGIPATHH